MTDFCLYSINIDYLPQRNGQLVRRSILEQLKKNIFRQKFHRGEENNFEANLVKKIPTEYSFQDNFKQTFVFF